MDYLDQRNRLRWALQDPKHVRFHGDPHDEYIYGVAFMRGEEIYVQVQAAIRICLTISDAVARQMEVLE
jgi:hypothetical protein